MTEPRPTTRRVGETTLHLHQVVHVADADVSRVPWFPSDYTVTSLAASHTDGNGSDGIRLVGLPVSDDSPVTTVSERYLAELVAKGDANARYASGKPVWGY